MSPATVLLGLDLGTSGCKGVLLDRGGRVLARALHEYSPDTPRPGWAEQDPEVWFRAAAQVSRSLRKQANLPPRAIAAVGLTGQMHSTVLLDDNLQPIRPAILWLDSRSAPQAAAFTQAVGRETLARWIGNPVMPGFTLATLLWLRESEPETWARLQVAVQPKDYVRWRMTGALATDPSDASATGLFDVRQGTWCAPLLERADFSARLVPPLLPSHAVAGTLQRAAARAFGLPEGLPVICGAGDQEAQALGNGLLDPGRISSTLGTGGQLFAPLSSYQFDSALRIHVMRHAVPERWHWLGATLTAGASLRWLRDQVLGGRYSYAALANAAAEIAPGAEGLFFLPYLAGERTPLMNPHVRGAFFGLALHHTWRHMARAVMEGAVLGLAQALTLIRAQGYTVHEVLASGGAARHPLWLQLQAEVYGMPVSTARGADAAARGAAMLAGIGVGVYAGFEEAVRSAVPSTRRVIRPDPAGVERYARLAERYAALSHVTANLAAGTH